MHSKHSMLIENFIYDDTPSDYPNKGLLTSGAVSASGSKPGMYFRHKSGAILIFVVLHFLHSHTMKTESVLISQIHSMVPACGYVA